MIFEGREVRGRYRDKLYNVAVTDRRGIRLTWLIKYYYKDERSAKRRAKALIPLYGAVKVIPPNLPTKGNHVKRRA